MRIINNKCKEKIGQTRKSKILNNKICDNNFKKYTEVFVSLYQIESNGFSFALDKDGFFVISVKKG